MEVQNTKYILKAEPGGFPGYNVRETDWHIKSYNSEMTKMEKIGEENDHSVDAVHFWMC